MSHVFAKNVIDSSSGIDRAFLRLLPDVFFHPVWIHFAEAGVSLLPEQIRSLLDAGDALLSAGNLAEACQTLFICAFLQMRSGDYAAASSNIQRILILTEQHDLLQVACWATWGAAAVCVRRGWFQQAADHLEHLQSLLGQQHEWVLSGVIDLIRRALLSQTQVEAMAGQALSPDAVLSSAFEQMLHWGTSCAAPKINYTGKINGHANHSIQSPSKSAGFSLHLLWRNIKRVFRGELRLRWVEDNGPASPSRSAEHNGAQPTLPLTLPNRHTSADQPAIITTRALLPGEDVTALRQPDPEQLPLFTPSQTATSDQGSVPVRLELPAEPATAAKSAVSPCITAHLLGTFSFVIDDSTVLNWPTGKGRAVLKYLLANHKQPIPRDVLMDAFWPQAGPEAARNSLNVALHGLRQALKTVTDKPVVLFEEGAYCINPAFQVWVDIDKFERHVQAGRRLEAQEQLSRAASEYEATVELYRGDLLAGDPYEEWPVLPRERLRVAYLDVLDRLSQIYFHQSQYADCVTLCQLALSRDACREDIHCLLMRCFSRQDQHHLALRQYQACVEALRTELDVAPASTTTQLFERIRRRESV